MQVVDPYITFHTVLVYKENSTVIDDLILLISDKEAQDASF